MPSSMNDRTKKRPLAKEPNDSHAVCESIAALSIEIEHRLREFDVPASQYVAYIDRVNFYIEEGEKAERVFSFYSDLEPDWYLYIEYLADEIVKHYRRYGLLTMNARMVYTAFAKATTTIHYGTVLNLITIGKP